MGCGGGKYVRDAKRKVVVVFGVTGRQGKSVLQQLQGDLTFKVIGVIRASERKVGVKLSEMGFSIVEADMDEPDSLRTSLPVAHACFIVTNYWEHFDITRDSLQGKNAVDWATETGVKHIIFSGQESPKSAVDKCCDPLDSKKRVEEYLKRRPKEVNYTVIRVPFLFDNLLSMVKPHRLDNGQFAIAYPMADVPLHGLAAEDVGKCVHKILKKPDLFQRKIVSLSSDQLTVQEHVDVLNKRLAPKIFVDPKITLDDYSQFSFKGSRELLATFMFYKLGRPFKIRDTKITKKLCKNILSFDDWVVKYRKQLTDVIAMSDKSLVEQIDTDLEISS